MNTWLIVAAVVVVAVAAVLLAVLLRRSIRHRDADAVEHPPAAESRSAGSDGRSVAAGAPPDSEHSAPASGVGAEDAPTQPVSTPAEAAPPDPGQDVRTVRLPTHARPANPPDPAGPTHVLPVVDPGRGVHSSAGSEPSRHARPEDERSQLPAPSGNGGGGKHRAPSEPAAPDRSADHQPTEPRGGPMVPNPRGPERPPATAPPVAARPNPGPPPRPPGPADGPPPFAVPAQRDPAPTGSELFEEANAAERPGNGDDDRGGRRTLADRLLGRNR